MPKANILDIRRDRVRELVRKWGGPGSLAKKLGHNSGSYLSQIAGPNPTRDISESVARDFEQRLGLPLGYLDHSSEESPSTDVNIPLVAEVVRAVMSGTSQLKQQPSADKVAEVVSLAYERAVSTGHVDTDYVQRLLRLME